MKLASLILLLPFLASAASPSGLVAPPLSGVSSKPVDGVIVGGSITSINQAITNVGRGGVVYVQSGDYYISNNAPVYVLEGRTLQGVGTVVFHVDTNGPDKGRLDFSTFQLFDNSVVRGITWEATNTWNSTDAGGHAYASFALSGFPCTNVLIDKCELQGGSDVFYSTNGTPGSLCVQDSRLTSWWDFFSTTYGGPVVSINCKWTGNGASTRPSRMNLTQAPWIDISSIFNGFAGMDASHAFPPNAMMFGSVLNFVPVNESYISKSSVASAGAYLQVYTNADGTLLYKTFSLSPDKGSYITNATTTNRVYAYNKTNIYVTAGNPDATINGTYVLGTTDGDFANGLSFWTNQTHVYFVLRLNDPADVSDEGNPPTFGIYSNNISKALGIVQSWNTTTVEGANILDLGDGVVSCTATLGTNSIVTNMIPTLYSALFNQAMAFIPTNGAIITLGTNKFAGNGSGLTNLSIASVNSVATASTAITFPNTTVNWTNTQGFNIVLYIDNSGVTGTATKKNGQQVFSSLVGDVTLLLKPGDYFSETYTVGTPTARWEPQ